MPNVHSIEALHSPSGGPQADRSFTLMGTSRIDPGNGTARAINSIPMPALELASSKPCVALPH